ncbi:TPA: alginate lyase family protein [Serratia fonticola]
MIKLSIYVFLIVFSNIVCASDYALISQNVKREIITSYVDQSVIDSAKSIVVKKPNAISNVHIEGNVIQGAAYNKIKNATYDWDKMKILAYAWSVTHSQVYLDTLSNYFTAWLDVYKITYNPIDEEKITNMIIAYDLVKDDLSSDLKLKMNFFIEKLLSGYLTEIEERGGKDFTNWQSHRLKIATFCAFILGDEKSIELIDKYYHQQLDNNLLADGAVYDYKLHDSYSYALYDLNSLLEIALVANRHGYDWFSYSNKNGGSLKKSLNWIISSTEKPSDKQFANSKIKFDAVRRVAGVKGMQSQWDPMQAQKTFAIASMIDRSYQKYLVKTFTSAKLNLLLF